MSSNYKYIRNLEELNKAQYKLKKKRLLKEAELLGQLSIVQEFYSPKNIIIRGINTAINYIPINSTMLNIVRFLKNKIS